MTRKKAQNDHKIICRNRKALHDFFIEERFEAGLVLRGTEVKSLREGRASLVDAYAVIDRNEIHLVNMHIGEWPGAAYFNHEPKRRRKLLMHARQIERLSIQITQRGATLVALCVYFNEKNRAKVELGLAKGKRKVDKRDTIRERDLQRSSQREGPE